MTTVITTLLYLFVSASLLLGFAFLRRGLNDFGIALASLSVVAWLSPVHALVASLMTLVAIGFGLLNVTGIRHRLISAPALKQLSRVLPRMSETEREAIDAGTVWWEGELFTGKPDWDRLRSHPAPSLTPEERAFIEGPVNELCRMSDAWRINHDWQVVPDHIVEYIREQGFLGMIIPKRYGGLGLSAYAQSQVLVRLSNSGGAVTYLVAVPNSLGPGELLIKYGTEAQKNHYLPRLAKGLEIPCFALTGPTAGSDATSIPDTGVVCKGQWQGEEVLGIRLNINKRYITLAPVATLIGLAFRLKDPDHLMGVVDDYGITCALIPRDVNGLEIGRRHLPVGDAFLNGPIRGTDVFVPLDAIIGGREGAGKGWSMLVNCLSVGRCITLPTTAVAVAKRMTQGSSAYAALRQQFGLSLSRFEGIRKPLARIAGLNYIIDAGRSLTISSLDHGEKPSVPAAITKYHCTEMARQCILDAMDIHGGKAVMKGPGNPIASCYESIPVAITVEGANIMTRNLMIFGQGATRGHPYVLREMALAKRADDPRVLPVFDRILFRHLGLTLSNAARALILGLTGGRFGRNVGHPSLRSHYRRIDRLSAAFALVADVSMLSLGARLKVREALSARLGDMLSMLYLASLVLRHHENAGSPEAERPALNWALAHLLERYQNAFVELMDNFPVRPVAWLLKPLVFPLGRSFKAPTDRLESRLADAVLADTPLRKRLVDGLYREPGLNNPLGHMESVFQESLVLAPLFDRLNQAVRSGRLPKLRGLELINTARRRGLLDEREVRRLMAFDTRLMEVINVDDFDESELIRKPYSADADHALDKVRHMHPPLREAV